MATTVKVECWMQYQMFVYLDLGTDDQLDLILSSRNAIGWQQKFT